MDSQLSLPTLLKCLPNSDNVNLVAGTFSSWTQYLSVAHRWLAELEGETFIWTVNLAAFAAKEKRRTDKWRFQAIRLHLSSVSWAQKEGQWESSVRSCDVVKPPSRIRLIFAHPGVNRQKLLLQKVKPIAFNTAHPLGWRHNCYFCVHCTVNSN